jgi:hypothetical protein
MYLVMSQLCLPTNWWHSTYRKKVKFLFLQDDATYDFIREVRCALNFRFLNRRIGRGRTSRSPMEVHTSHHWRFLWGFCKRVCLAAKIRDLHQLRGTINTSVAPVTPGNASTNIERNWVTSKCLQGYERCRRWGILRYVPEHDVLTLQQTPFLYLSCHSSYYVLTLNLKFVSPCIIVQFKQITNQMQQSSSLLSWRLFAA